MLAVSRSIERKQTSELARISFGFRAGTSEDDLPARAFSPVEAALDEGGDGE